MKKHCPPRCAADGFAAECLGGTREAPCRGGGASAAGGSCPGPRMPYVTAHPLRPLRRMTSIWASSGRRLDGRMSLPWAGSTTPAGVTETSVGSRPAGSFGRVRLCPVNASLTRGPARSTGSAATDAATGTALTVRPDSRSCAVTVSGRPRTRRWMRSLPWPSSGSDVSGQRPAPYELVTKNAYARGLPPICGGGGAPPDADGGGVAAAGPVRVVGAVVENPASSSKTSRASSAATILPPGARSPSPSRPDGQVEQRGSAGMRPGGCLRELAVLAIGRVHAPELPLL